MLFLSRFEISRIRWLLPFLDRHQKSVPAHIVALFADQDEGIVLGAFVEEPDWIRIRFASVFFCDRPRPGQRMVDRSNLVDESVLVRLVE